MKRKRKNPGFAVDVGVRVRLPKEKDLTGWLFAGTVPLDEQLIQHLASVKGMPIEDLRKLHDDGFRYCPERDSFLSVPEIFGDVPDDVRRSVMEYWE